jgi:hypothetical protein
VPDAAKTEGVEHERMRVAFDRVKNFAGEVFAEARRRRSNDGGPDAEDRVVGPQGIDQ